MAPRAPSPDEASRRKVSEDDDAFWQQKVDTARASAASGDDRGALELLACALALDPPSPWDQRLKSVRVEIKARHVDTDVLRVDARGIRDYVEFGSDVGVVVRFRNVGADPIVIRAPEGVGPDATSGAALVLSLERRDVDVYAAEMKRAWTQVVPIVTEGTGELRLAPEQVHEIRAKIPAEEAGGPIAGVHVLSISGTLRAGRIETSLGEPVGSVPVRAGRVLVLPSNYEPLAIDPIASLERAVEAAAPVHLLVATQFVPADRRPDAVRVLARALTDGSTSLGTAALAGLRSLRQAAIGTPLRPLAAPLMEALARRPVRMADLMEGLVVTTGLAIAPDPRLWEDWWRREQTGPGSTIDPEDRPAPHAAPRATGKPPSKTHSAAR